MQLLSKAECSALRGFAILGIFMHNYLHWLRPMVKENEYVFQQRNVDRLMGCLAEPGPDLLLQLFSFFGHYGVPVFLFLSGYGLVMKYEAGAAPSEGAGIAGGGGFRQFVWHHYRKLFPMMFLGFALFAMLDTMTPGAHHWAWADVIALLTMTINLLPSPDKIIWPGPYWFFGLMMQLYIVYRLLLWRRHWAWAVGLIAVSWLVQEACASDPAGDTLNRIRYNCIGGMLPFCLGLLAARLPQGDALSRLPRKALGGSGLLAPVVAVLSVVLVFALSLGFHAWLWVPFFVVTLHVAAVKMLPGVALRALGWLGGLSAAIFVCHPITRKIFIKISRQGDIMDGLALYVVATILLAMLFRLVITKMNKR